MGALADRMRRAFCLLICVAATAVAAESPLLNFVPAGAAAKRKRGFNGQVFLKFTFQFTLEKQRNSLRQFAGYCENGYFYVSDFILRCFSNGIGIRGGGAPTAGFCRVCNIQKRV